MDIITPEQIAARAYQRFLERGGQHGHDVEDWLAAQEELQRRYEVVLVDAGARVIEVVRAIRELTGLELRDIQFAVEHTPAPLRRDIAAAQAEALKVRLEALGARLDVRVLAS